MAKMDNSNFMNRLKANVGLWFIIGMVLLLLVRIVMWTMESGASGGEVVSPIPVKLEPKMNPETSLDYIKVNKLLTPWKDFKDSDLYLLAQYNMFDPKLVQNADAMDRSADEKVKQAKDLFDRGNLQQARELVRQGLMQKPNHLDGQNLLKSIDAALAKGATAVTSATQPRAGVAGTTQPLGAGR